MGKTVSTPGRASTAYLRKMKELRTMGKGHQPHLENVGNSSLPLLGFAVEYLFK